MDAYEKMINTIRREGNRKSPSFFRLGTMTSANTCDIGTIELEADDLAKVDGIQLKKGDDVIIAKVEEKYIIIGKVVDV